MKTNLISYNIEELVAAEKAASTVIKFYENDAVTLADMYRGKDQELSAKIARASSARAKIIKEMEKRLLDIE